MYKRRGDSPALAVMQPVGGKRLECANWRAHCTPSRCTSFAEAEGAYDKQLIGQPSGVARSLPPGNPGAAQMEEGAIAFGWGQPSGQPVTD